MFEEAAELRRIICGPTWDPIKVESLNTNGQPVATHEMFSNSPGGILCCEKGLYLNQNGNDFGCSPCPPGGYQDNSKYSQATGCKQCSPGFFQENSSAVKCVACPVGYHQDKVGKAFCLPCFPGKYQNEAGKARCKVCEAGRYKAELKSTTECKLCPKGTFSRDPSEDREKCIPCSPGKWSNVTSAHNNAVCRNCSAGRYSSAAGMSKESSCIFCPQGKFGEEDGHTTSAQGCHYCHKGQYRGDDLEATSCKACGKGFYQNTLGQASCLPCLPGEFGNETGMQSCHKCDIGKVSGEPNSTACLDCKAGQSSDTKGSAKCTSCAAGQYSSSGGNSCSVCPQGFYQTTPGNSFCFPLADGTIVLEGGAAVVKVPLGSYIDCSTDEEGSCQFKPCPAGRYGHDPPQESACMKCPAGWSSFDSSIKCSLCAKGKFASNPGVLCQDCPTGYFQPHDSAGSITCEQCPAGYTQNSTGESACLSLNWLQPEDCGTNQYLNNTDIDPLKWKCESCPAGGSCSDQTTTWSTLGPMFGWWKIPKEDLIAGGLEPSWKSTIVFVECQYHPACLGAPNRALQKRYISDEGVDLSMAGTLNASSTCSTLLGFRNDSRLCHSCNATSRRLSSSRCTKCPNTEQNLSLMVLGLLVAIFVVCFVVGSTIHDAGKQRLSSAVQKTLLNYLQIASLALAFPLRWPPVLQSLFEFQSAASTLGEALVNPDCVASSSSAAALFYAKQVGFSAIPFVTVIVAFVFWYAYGVWRNSPFFAKRQNEGIKSSTPKDKFVVTITVILYLIFPTLCTQAFRLFDCRTIAGIQYLAVDLEHRCYEGAHLVAVLLLGIGQLVVFVIGLPAFVFLLLQRNRKISGGLDRNVVQMRYGLFFSAYREERYFWELVLTARKVGIVAISVFGRSIGTQRQAQIALLILFACACLEIAGDPYMISSDRHKILSRLELGSLFCLWGTMWCGTLIFASQGPDEEGLVTVLSMLVAVMNIGLMIWLIFQLVLETAFENKQSRIVGVMERLTFGICSRGSSQLSSSKGGQDVNSAQISVEMSSGVPNPLRAGKADSVFNPAVALETPSSDEWSKYFDASSSQYYWYNEVTGESKWDE